MVRKPVATRATQTHPRLGAELAARTSRWRRLSDADQDALVEEAVASMLERGYWMLDGARSATGKDLLLSDELCEAYLDGAGVGELLGVDRKTALSYRLPPHEAQIGRVRGWRTSTIIRWNANRPRMTEGVDVEIRDELNRQVLRYETKAGRDIPVAEWLVARERLIAKRLNAQPLESRPPDAGV